MVENYHGKFHVTCLNQQWFIDLTAARHNIEVWKIHYITVRQHSSLGFLSPGWSGLASAKGYGKDSRSKISENSGKVRDMF